MLHYQIYQYQIILILTLAKKNENTDNPDKNDKNIAIENPYPNVDSLQIEFLNYYIIA